MSNKWKKIKKKIKDNIMVFLLLIIFILFAILILNKYLSLEVLPELALEMFISICISILIYIIITSITYSDDEKSNSYYDNLREKIILHVNGSVELNQNRDEKHSDDNRDIIELMIANMKEINEYYVLSKRMTRQSFILAVCMCIGGFLIISTAVAFILINNIEAKEAIIPVISGAVIEAIAATTLIVYKKSLEQLNRYYDALHNNEIFLSSVNLVSKISTDKRDQMYEYIIKTKLEDKPKQNNTEGQ